MAARAAPAEGSSIAFATRQPAGCICTTCTRPPRRPLCRTLPRPTRHCGGWCTDASAPCSEAACGSCSATPTSFSITTLGPWQRRRRRRAPTMSSGGRCKCCRTQVSGLRTRGGGGRWCSIAFDTSITRSRARAGRSSRAASFATRAVCSTGARISRRCPPRGSVRRGGGWARSGSRRGTARPRRLPSEGRRIYITRWSSLTPRIMSSADTQASSTTGARSASGRGGTISTAAVPHRRASPPT
mmetsp:Transcript_2446/g.4746  ORF Transcript_2446/g.4746 Transcript_2446/m.4746 type:complete len:243 (+) Transcript_2446:546-1274(+)